MENSLQGKTSAMQVRADKIYSKLINRALKMMNKEKMTEFNNRVNGYSNNGKPHFLAAFRLSKYNTNDQYQKQWDKARAMVTH